MIFYAGGDNGIAIFYNSDNQTDLFVWITPGVSLGLVNINQHISTITDLINSFPGPLPLTVSKHSQNPLECTW